MIRDRTTAWIAALESEGISAAEEASPNREGVVNLRKRCVGRHLAVVLASLDSYYERAGATAVAPERPAPGKRSRWASRSHWYCQYLS